MFGLYARWVWGGRPDHPDVPFQKGSLYVKAFDITVRCDMFFQRHLCGSVNWNWYLQMRSRTLSTQPYDHVLIKLVIVARTPFAWTDSDFSTFEIFRIFDRCFSEFRIFGFLDFWNVRTLGLCFSNHLYKKNLNFLCFSKHFCKSLSLSYFSIFFYKRFSFPWFPNRVCTNISSPRITFQYHRNIMWLVPA